MGGRGVAGQPPALLCVVLKVFSELQLFAQQEADFLIPSR